MATGSTQNDRSSGLDIDILPVPSKVNDHTVIGFGAYGILPTIRQNKDLARDAHRSSSQMSKRRRPRVISAAPCRAAIGGRNRERSSPIPTAPSSTTRRLRNHGGGSLTAELRR